MTLIKDIKGLKIKGTLMQWADITVRISSDSKGKSLSLADDNEGIMLMIPLESIESDLKEIL